MPRQGQGDPKPSFRALRRRDSGPFRRTIFVSDETQPRPRAKSTGRDACVIVAVGPWVRAVAVEAYRWARLLYGSRDGAEPPPLVPPARSPKTFLVPIRCKRPEEEEPEPTPARSHEDDEESG